MRAEKWEEQELRRIEKMRALRAKGRWAYILGRGGLWGLAAAIVWIGLVSWIAGSRPPARFVVGFLLLCPLFLGVAAGAVWVHMGRDLRTREEQFAQWMSRKFE